MIIDDMGQMPNGLECTQKNDMAGFCDRIQEKNFINSTAHMMGHYG